MPLNKLKKICSQKSCFAFLLLAISISVLAAFAPDYAYAQQAGKAKKNKAAAGETKTAKKEKKERPKPGSENNAETASGEAVGNNSTAGGAGKFIERAALKGSGMLEIIYGAIHEMSKKNPEKEIKLSIFSYFIDEDSSEIRFIFSKTPDREVSLKNDYLSRYPSPQYFVFESDFLGARGYQIISKPSAASYIDLVCYQMSTDSVFLAYAVTAPSAPKNKVRPKLTLEPGFFRSALVSAREFVNNQGFSFFETWLLKKFKHKKGFETISAQSSISAGDSGPLVLAYSYINQSAAREAFKNFSMSRDSRPEEAAANHKKDAGFNYYLTDRHVIAVSNSLY
ncbi:MAG TPA: hypothetical protein PKW98_03055 [Candidatus Wallbacteria bacterium]|nr:hypothetical protein [Candidatus Wallbacteria bacterium]